VHADAQTVIASFDGKRSWWRRRPRESTDCEMMKERGIKPEWRCLALRHRPGCQRAINGGPRRRAALYQYRQPVPMLSGRITLHARLLQTMVDHLPATPSSTSAPSARRSCPRDEFAVTGGTCASARRQPVLQAGGVGHQRATGRAACSPVREMGLRAGHPGRGAEIIGLRPLRETIKRCLLEA